MMFFLSLCLDVTIVVAQNVDDDLKQIALKYQPSGKVLINKTINYYSDYKNNKPKETSKTILKKRALF